MATTVFTGELGRAGSQAGLVMPGGPVSSPPAAAPSVPVASQGNPQRGAARLDIEIDGNPYKLNIPPDHLRKPFEPIPKDVYDCQEVEPLLTRIGSGQGLNYGDFPASVESIEAQDNWTNGLSPTRLQVITDAYWSSLGVDARRPKQLILQPQPNQVIFSATATGMPTRMVDFAGGTYVIAGQAVWKLGTGPLQWNPVLTAAGTTFSDLVVYNNLLLACNGPNYWYSSDGATWTQSTLTATTDAPKADLFTVIRSQLWKAVKPNKVYSCADPTNGAGTTTTWTSTATQIGDQARNITSLAAFHVDLAVGKEDGLWTVDRAGNDFPILPELRSVADAENGKNMKLWRTGLMVKLRNGLFRYEGGKLLSLGLDRYRPSGITAGQLALRAVDIAPYLNECFVAHKPLSQNGIYLMVLMENPWRWHSFFYQPGFLPTMVGLSANAFSFPSLWIGRDNTAGGFDMIYLQLPNASDNPLDDKGYIYDTSTGLTLTTVELSPLPDQDKFWSMLRLRVLAGGAGGAGTVAVSYSLDPPADPAVIPWTPMVGPQGQVTQPTSKLVQEWFFGNPPTRDGAAALAVSKSIILRLTLATSLNTSSPVVKHTVLHFKHRPQARKRWKVQCVCEEGTRGDRFFEDKRDPETQVTDLLQSRSSTPPVKFVDLLGLTWDVVIETVHHRLLEKQPGGSRRYAVDVTMLEHVGTAEPALQPRSV